MEKRMLALCLAVWLALSCAGASAAGIHIVSGEVSSVFGTPPPAQTPQPESGPAAPVEPAADEPGPASGTVIAAERMQVGDVVTFGSYRQSGGEDSRLNWVVIGMGQALNSRGEPVECAYLLSQSTVDYHRFHELFAKTAWEKCDLRAWLNDDFLGKFTAEETAALLEADILTDGTATRDRVWLLSEAEYDSLRPLLETALRGCTGRAAERRETFAGGVEGWWLRDSGKTASRARYVGDELAGDVIQAEVDQYRGVRPVIAIAQPGA